MSIVGQIKPLVVKALKDLYGQDFTEQELTINITKPEFEGDYTLVLFSFVKQLKKSPEQLGNEIGEALMKASPDIFAAHNVIKGFLNFTIAENYWIKFLQTNYADPKLYYIRLSIFPIHQHLLCAFHNSGLFVGCGLINSLTYQLFNLCFIFIIKLHIVFTHKMVAFRIG